MKLNQISFLIFAMANTVTIDVSVAINVAVAIGVAVTTCGWIGITSYLSFFLIYYAGLDLLAAFVTNFF